MNKWIKYSLVGVMFLAAFCVAFKICRGDLCRVDLLILGFVVSGYIGGIAHECLYDLNWARINWKRVNFLFPTVGLMTAFFVVALAESAAIETSFLQKLILAGFLSFRALGVFKWLTIFVIAWAIGSLAWPEKKKEG